MQTNYGSGSYIVGDMKLTTYLCLLHGSIHPLPLMPSWCGTSNVFDVFHFLDCMENFPLVVPHQIFSSVWVWAIYSMFYHIMVFWVATTCSIHLFQHFRGTSCLPLQVGLNLVQVSNETNVLPSFFIIQCGLQKVKSWFCQSVVMSIFPVSLGKGGVYVLI